VPAGTGDAAGWSRGALARRAPEVGRGCRTARSGRRRCCRTATRHGGLRSPIVANATLLGHGRPPAPERALMIRFPACASVALAIVLAIPARGEQAPGAAASSAADVASQRPSLAQQQDHSSADAVDPAAAELREALRRRLAGLPEGTNDEERS